MRRSTGYTLIEMMISLSILGVIMALAYPSYAKHIERVDTASVETDFVQIDMAAERYYASYGSYPPDLETVGMARDDPWGNPYSTSTWP